MKGEGCMDESKGWIGYIGVEDVEEEEEKVMEEGGKIMREEGDIKGVGRFEVEEDKKGEVF